MVLYGIQTVYEDADCMQHVTFSQEPEGTTLIKRQVVMLDVDDSCNLSTYLHTVTPLNDKSKMSMMMESFKNRDTNKIITK